MATFKPRENQKVEKEKQTFWRCCAFRSKDVFFVFVLIEFVSFCLDPQNKTLREFLCHLFGRNVFKENVAETKIQGSKQRETISRERKNTIFGPDTKTSPKMFCFLVVSGSRLKRYFDWKIQKALLVKLHLQIC